MKTVWHYTTAAKLPGIGEAEAIFPATAGVPPREIPAVWLSTAAVWEHTATKGVVGENGKLTTATVAEMIEMAGGLVRLEIDPAKVKLIRPLELQRKLRIEKQTWRGLVTSAKKVGADPSEWCAVAGPIPVDAIASMEICRQDPIVWEPVGPLRPPGH
jgi:hypothetical protein